MDGLLSRYAILDRSLKRKDLEKLFTEKLNAERNGRKPLSVSFVSYRMSLARLNKKDDLVAFFLECSSKNSFAKWWWWSLTPHQIPQSDAK